MISQRPQAPTPRVGVESLVDRWRQAGVPFVVVDPDGCRAWDQTGEVRHVDLASTPVQEPAHARALLDRSPHLVLDAGSLPEEERTHAIGRALVALACLRTWRQGPQWIVLDHACALLTDPELPPEALDVAAGGYCLVDA
ncbi:MAG TPA: hypothetical protein VMT69_15955 [Kineosporiaceae bacterium]|nr:hypothetical protein [Kineosporiaceae bacterium]